MYFLMFFLWIAFNGRITGEIVIFGIGICTALYYFMVKVMDYSFKSDMEILKLTPNIIKYIYILIIEIFKSNFMMMRVLFSRKMNVKSDIIEFHSGLHTDRFKSVLANSITLTPGTITVNVKGDKFIIHTLDTCFSEGIEKCNFVLELQKMEEKLNGRI